VNNKHNKLRHTHTRA